MSTNQPSPLFSNMVEMLQKQAEKYGDKKAFIYLVNGETSHFLTYRELDARARIVASFLQKKGVARGERALLVFPSGLDFIYTFFGCLYAGVIAVPAYPPNKHVDRLQAIAVDAKANVALTTSKIIKGMKTRLSSVRGLDGLEWLASDEITRTEENRYDPISIDQAETAFLQYTSGSAGSPKGVVLNHTNLVSNVHMLHTGSQSEDSWTVVTWLPMYHDMGMIGTILQPLYTGATCIVMAPVEFLQKPYHWLKALSDYRAEYSGAPNFAYDLCVARISDEQMKTLDLSHWKIAFSGAEPVRHHTVARFIEKFSACGFKPESFYPTFGLAETTLMVTGAGVEDPPRFHTVDAEALKQDRVVAADETTKETLTFVGCGHPWFDTQVRIVHPETWEMCGEGEVGEIWVAGSIVAQGYWNRPDATEETFHVRIKDTGEGPFLRTGDLGYVHNGHLFITGRLKEVIIIRGKNHYPQDLEFTAEQSHPALIQNASAAFSILEKGEERLVIVAELNRHYHLDTEPPETVHPGRLSLSKKEVLRSVRQSISECHELQVYDLVLIPQGKMMKTSSGKIQRRAMKQAYLDRSLERLDG
ncbi:fatty acyl-AMP ligase [Laceyella putida]|uniref:Fatty acyl-AMP ligase n=1 Tax=Laceyella putida TaxID=110101 RepID=A0ABW2RHU0_9BACL